MDNKMGHRWFLEQSPEAQAYAMAEIQDMGIDHDRDKEQFALAFWLARLFDEGVREAQWLGPDGLERRILSFYTWWATTKTAYPLHAALHGVQEASLIQACLNGHLHVLNQRNAAKDIPSTLSVSVNPGTDGLMGGRQQLLDNIKALGDQLSQCRSENSRLRAVEETARAAYAALEIEDDKKASKIEEWRPLVRNREDVIGANQRLQREYRGKCSELRRLQARLSLYRSEGARLLPYPASHEDFEGQVLRQRSEVKRWKMLHGLVGARLHATRGKLREARREVELAHRELNDVCASFDQYVEKHRSGPVTLIVNLKNHEEC